MKTIIFLNNPIEMAYIFYQIHQEIKGIDVWKLIIVGAQLPNAEIVLGFPYQWKTLPAMPKIFIPAINAVVTAAIELRALYDSIHSAVN